MKTRQIRARIRIMQELGITVQSVKFDADGSVTISSAAPKGDTSFDKFLEE